LLSRLNSAYLFSFRFNKISVSAMKAKLHRIWKMFAPAFIK
jgi:hypothetical protein